MMNISGLCTGFRASDHQELASVSSCAQLESRAATTSSSRLGMAGLNPSQCPGTNIFQSAAPWREGSKGESTCKCHRLGEPEGDGVQCRKAQRMSCVGGWRGGGHLKANSVPPHPNRNSALCKFLLSAHHRALSPLQYTVGLLIRTQFLR